MELICECLKKLEAVGRPLDVIESVNEEEMQEPVVITYEQKVLPPVQGIVWEEYKVVLFMGSCTFYQKHICISVKDICVK